MGLYDNEDKEFDELRRQSAAVKEKKDFLNLAGMIGDASNTPSFGEIYLGRQVAKPNYSKMVSAAADGISDPLEEKKKLLDAYREQKLVNKDVQSADPNSDASQRARGFIMTQSPKLGKSVEGMSADQVHEAFPMLKTFIEADTKKKNQEMMTDRWDGRYGNREILQDRRLHGQVLGKLQSDKQLNQRLVQYQNLDNALSNFSNAEHTTPQQLDELQQSIRSNLGIKGSSGVGEREHTYINSLGLSSDRMKQFLTGNPSDIAKDSNLLTHLKDLAKLEQGNIHDQFEGRMNAVTSGYEDLYDRRPELKAGLMNAIKAYKGQITTPLSDVNQAQSSETGTGGLIPSANASEDMISVISPDGKQGKIPRAKLDQAKKRGFRVN